MCDTNIVSCDIMDCTCKTLKDYSRVFAYLEVLQCSVIVVQCSRVTKRAAAAPGKPRQIDAGYTGPLGYHGDRVD